MELDNCPQTSNNIRPRSPNITLLLMTQMPILWHKVGPVEIGCLPPTLQNCTGEPAPNCLRKVQIIQIIAAALQCVASPLCRVQVGV